MDSVVVAIFVIVIVVVVVARGNHAGGVAAARRLACRARAEEDPCKLIGASDLIGEEALAAEATGADGAVACDGVAGRRVTLILAAGVEAVRGGQVVLACAVDQTSGRRVLRSRMRRHRAGPD